jgi:hypothetical protein
MLAVPPPLMGAFVIVALTALLGLGSFVVLHEWRLKQLRWRHLTVHNCRRYLTRRGWRDTGSENPARLDKAPFSIALTTILADPATANAVEQAITGLSRDGRQVVVLVPGAITPGVAETMQARGVIVAPYRQLAELETMLREHQGIVSRSRVSENRARAAPAFPPTPATLITAAPAAALAPAHAAMIAETEHVQCSLRDYGTDTLVIAFNDSWRLGPSGRLRCGPAAENPGFSILDITTRSPNWFPADDMAAVVPAARALLAGRFANRVTFGFSQGGYGAIKFSRVLEATTTIAFSPQASIDPRVVAGGRFASYFDFGRNAGMGIAAGDCLCPAYVFYDPYDDQDRRQVEDIGKIVSITQIGVPFSGHGTSRLFATPERLREIVRGCQEADLAAMMRLVAGLRHDMPGRALQMAMVLASARPAVAIRICEAYRTTWSVGQQVAIYYRIAINGEAEVALSWFETLAAAHGEDAEVQGGAALVAIEAGQTDLAARFIARARAVNPSSAKWGHVEQRVRQLHMNA